MARVSLAVLEEPEVFDDPSDAHRIPLVVHRGKLGADASLLCLGRSEGIALYLRRGELLLGRVLGRALLYRDELVQSEGIGGLDDESLVADVVAGKLVVLMIDLSQIPAGLRFPFLL
eukprot:CAMPEP_0170489850 /NCGR_PEP_ID=MMETSP0208-20121228/8160_1 /TAXON_ID=197538 /ORGANISM="Strombidium inclinatum, Strain S3" /LENGTH=116 /DNA_ID=CAMNT_0010764981 /DNA_START=154 /DNA_END=504 /DNA_ORIENTATION=-